VSAARTDLRPPIAVMTARPAPALPEDGQGERDICFEPKLDGWRCVAFHRANGRVALQSRQRKPLTVYFPEIAAAVGERVPAGSVLDGELVAYHGGRCDFVALQRRVTGRLSLACPVTFVVFDVLVLAGDDLRGLPYRKRRKRLRRLLDGATPPLALMPATRELVGAKAWMRDYADAGVEGVVIKHRQHGYRPRLRSSWRKVRSRRPRLRSSWRKVRSRMTADAVVGGVIGPLKAPEMLVLGLPDDRGRLRVAGRTGPLTLPARWELGGLLVPPQRAHPWPQRISSSRFGQLPPQPVDYTPTEPLVVVEVDADTCFEQQRWRHATTYRRVRGDLELADLD
jgi:ATP-dependent DNA ligase